MGMFSTDLPPEPEGFRIETTGPTADARRIAELEAEVEKLRKALQSQSDWLEHVAINLDVQLGTSYKALKGGDDG